MDYVIYLPILFFSVVLHEYSHGYTAYRYGDDTAYLMGRLSFNPIKHVDPVGTILIPLVCIMSGMPPFGWAKPVPVNFYRLNDPVNDMAKVALAGPVSNLILVLISALILKVMVSVGNFGGIFTSVLFFTVMINLLLAIFNLIPVPPLDGSRILAALLPKDLSNKYMQLERYGMLIVIVLIVTRLFNVIVMPIFNLAFSLVISFTGVSQYVQF